MPNELERPNKTTNARDHFANERTFLAWTRTSLGVMAFGFVVEKFSLFIKEISTLLGSPHSHHTHAFFQGASSIFGITLVAIGALICLLAFLQYRAAEKEIENGTYKPSIKLNIFLTSSLLSIGILLAAYLIISI
jgi:uncharacterized membrane protein YidH (DUF202 family)